MPVRASRALPGRSPHGIHEQVEHPLQLLAHDDRALLIAGTSNPAHLAENIAVGGLRLDAKAIATLDELADPE
jgi:diketogulonate reductase-like aldo/keto reductase